MEILFGILIGVIVYTILYFAFVPLYIKWGKRDAKFYHDLYFVDFTVVRDFEGPQRTQVRYQDAYNTSPIKNDSLHGPFYARAYRAEAARLGKPVNK